MPFAYVASIALREFRAAVHTVACKPFREHTLGKFVIRRTAIESVDVEVALNEETLKLDRRFEVRRSEEAFDSSTKLWGFVDVVEMFVPVLGRIGQQMMVFYVIFGDCEPLLRLSCQKLRISVLR